MDITVYLPDEVGQRAKAADPDLNLSRLLRGAVESELDRRGLVARMTGEATEHELPLLSDDDSPYTGILNGVQIAENIYLTNDERLMFYDENRQKLDEVENVDLLREVLNNEQYIAVCAALGEPARIDV